MYHRKALFSAVIAAGFAAFSFTGARAADLVDFKVVGHEIPKPLVNGKADPKHGRELVIHRKKGNCLACHRMPIPEQPDHGLAGPDLHGVGSRMTAAELRLRLVDPKMVSPETMMPAFYKVKGLHRVRKKFQGKPMLSAQEIEDIIAYLVTLKDE
jgi:sulfur-oxidizing protein SoxX